MNFLREHKTLILTLLPLATTFAGVWLGSKVQAGGAYAQAEAAEKAAKTAATATLRAVREQADHAAAAAHVAALREQRISAATNLIRADRALGRVLDTMLWEPDTDSTPAYDELLHAWGVVQLVAPASLKAASDDVLETSQASQSLARGRGEAYRLRMQLSLVRAWMPEYDDARQALAAMDAWRAAYAATDTNMMEAHSAASAALDRIPSLGTEERSALLNDCMEPAADPLIAECGREHNEAMNAFVDCARSVLGVED